MAPGLVIEQFSNDLADLIARGRGLLSDWQRDANSLMHQAEQLQGLAASLLNNVAVRRR